MRVNETFEPWALASAWQYQINPRDYMQHSQLQSQRMKAFCKLIPGFGVFIPKGRPQGFLWRSGRIRSRLCWAYTDRYCPESAARLWKSAYLTFLPRGIIGVVGVLPGRIFLMRATWDPPRPFFVIIPASLSILYMNLEYLIDVPIEIYAAFSATKDNIKSLDVLPTAREYEFFWVRDWMNGQ